MIRVVLCLTCILLAGCAASNPAEITGNQVKEIQSKTSTSYSSKSSLEFSPPPVTSQETLIIPGKVNPGSELYVNQQKQWIDSDGRFTAEINLQEGINVIPLKVVSPNSRFSTSVKIEYIPEKKKPDVHVGLDDHYSYSHIIFQGSTNPENKVTINRIPVTIQENGEFLSEIFLVQGKHLVTIEATNKDNIKTTIQKQVSVTYPIQQPTLIVSIPVAPGFVSEDRIRITGFTDPKNIVEIYNNYYNSNGKEAFSRIAYANIDSKGVFAADVYLNPGPNLLTIRAIDHHGFVKEEVRKVYSKNNIHHSYNVPKGYGYGYNQPDTGIMEETYKQEYDKVDREDR